MSLLSEALVISGVGMDLVGAVILSRAHNAESILEIREEIDGEGRALGEEDELATHAQLLAEKRVGFLVLAVGLSLYLIGLVLKSPEGIFVSGSIALVVVSGVLGGSVLWIRHRKRKILAQAREAERSGDDEALPEQ